VDHRKLPRKRGEALVAAIHEATRAELAETGYAGLTIEAVAERAHTGKASVYRRWPTKIELVIDAVYSGAWELFEPPDTGSLRADVLGLLRQIARGLDGPLGDVLRGLFPAVLSDPELDQARLRLVDPGPEPMLAILRRAADRGEVRAEALTDLVAGVGPVLLRQHFMVHGAPIPDDLITRIVDEVVLPLVRSREL
jgi:AcrR family transcriptional regulator